MLLHKTPPLAGPPTTRFPAFLPTQARWAKAPVSKSLPRIPVSFLSPGSVCLYPPSPEILRSTLRSIDSDTGSGIDLYGNATRATFQVGLNRKSGGKTSGDVLVGPSSDLLASFSNLPLDTYTVTLTANTSSSPSSFIAFERAVITGAVEVTNLDKCVNGPNYYPDHH